MKRKYVLFMTALLLVMGVSAQQKEYSGEMHVTLQSLQQEGDSVYVKLTFDISGVNVDSRRSISLVPALVATDNRLYLPEVVVKGRENYNVYQREIALMSNRQKAAYASEAPYAVIPGFKSKNSKTIDYHVTVKYSSWMADAKLDMYEDLCGCGNPARRMGITMLANQITLEKIIEPYEITPYMAYVQPDAEPVKRREIVGEAFLDFVVNKIDIRPDYMNNPRELKKVTDLVSEVKNDPDITVRAINVIGYASPEGLLSNNQRLSEGRAKALVGYLIPRFDYPKNLYKVTFGGENWDGLKECVEASQMPYRKEVLELIGSFPAECDYASQVRRKKTMMNLKGGEPYKYIIREFCPLLRKAICKIDFDVRNFSIDQAKEVFKSRPQNLSLNEMFLVANTYEKGSQEFVDLFETAVRLFPNDITANLNAAAAALSRRDITYAKRYLDNINKPLDIPEYYNIMGVLEILCGDYNEAASHLNKAAEMGLSEAKQNLAEMAKKQENDSLIEQQKLKKQR